LFLFLSMYSLPLCFSSFFPCGLSCAPVRTFAPRARRGVVFILLFFLFPHVALIFSRCEWSCRLPFRGTFSCARSPALSFSFWEFSLCCKVDSRAERHFKHLMPQYPHSPPPPQHPPCKQPDSIDMAPASDAILTTATTSVADTSSGPVHVKAATPKAATHAMGTPQCGGLANLP